MPEAGGKMPITFTVNGDLCTVEVLPMERLLDVLREKLRLTGTKEGCGEGECGGCSVLIDGDLVNSCLVPIAQVSGARITTIEGIGSGANAECLNNIQEAFIECGGAQCGICTPGMIMAAVYLLERNPHPTEAQIRHGLAGNLCRCTGYMKIFDAVVKACRLRIADRGLRIEKNDLQTVTPRPLTQT
jgi:carbon-monoxide dehydrogenase small subunit